MKIKYVCENSIIREKVKKSFKFLFARKAFTSFAITNFIVPCTLLIYTTNGFVLCNDQNYEKKRV